MPLDPRIAAALNAPLKAIPSAARLAVKKPRKNPRYLSHLRP